MSKKWLDQPIPEIYSEVSQLTPSQRKVGPVQFSIRYSLPYDLTKPSLPHCFLHYNTSPNRGDTTMLTHCLQYFDMIETWGTWAEFQLLLSKLSSIAQKYGPAISLTNVATRWVLQQPAVGAVIVGTRLGVSSHAAENLSVFNFILDEEDIAIINRAVLSGPGMDKAKAVFDRLGDCGNEYRAMH